MGPELTTRDQKLHAPPCEPTRYPSFLLLSCISSLYILIQGHYQIHDYHMIYKYVLPSCGLPFQFLDSVFQNIKVEEIFGI